MNFQVIFDFNANCLISLALKVIKLSLINVDGETCRATNLFHANNKLSDDSVGTNSRWILHVTAQVKIRV